MSILDKAVVASIPLIPKRLVRFFADPYIAGERLSDAVDTVKLLNRQGIMATVDVLGESVTRPEETSAPFKRYLQVIKAIDEEKLDANISIKPTQMGLGLDPEFCFENYRKIISQLEKYDNFVRVDMEDSPYTTLTLDLHDKLKSTYAKVGVVIQAYMRRSMRDLEERLILAKANIRLCKGIYVEPQEIAYKDYGVVRRNYVRLLEKALKAGMYVGIATHDEMLIWEAYRIIEELQLSPEQYEFQMLLGVTEKLRTQIVKDGHRMRVYVPFGKDWYAYSTRRLKENPQVAGYVFKDIFNLNQS
ncbi:proline dehydrogenase family protein [bacterium]|nr:proline dehydrogenase family protein [bacterium]